MKRILPLLIMLLGVPLSAGASYYWDNPSYLLHNSPQSMYSDVRLVQLQDSFIVFVLERAGSKSSLITYSTENFQDFRGPHTILEGIEVGEGFYNHYDLLHSGENLFLVWNDIEGSIRFMKSADGGISWSEGRRVVRPGVFSFHPHLFIVNDNLVLTYHSESEGRRIDFYYLFSRDKGKSWSKPYRLPGDYTGSFFPFVAYYRGYYFIAWQARPFSKSRTPVFDIYLATTDDLGKPWRPPINLTDSSDDEDIRPQLLFENDRFSLLWESERDGTTGVYYREFNLLGKPLAPEWKVNKSIVGAREPKILKLQRELYIFYIDERDGRERLYYAVRDTGDIEEFGPLPVVDDDIVHHLPFQKEGELYQIWQDGEGIGFTGPDKRVLPVKFLSTMHGFIGKGGKVVKWFPPTDSSGIAGYCYEFNRSEIFEPEIVNLSSSMNSLHLKVQEEGTWYLHIRAMDNAGNLSTTLTLRLISDLIPPEAPVLSSPPLDDEGFYKDNAPVFEWTSADPDVEGYHFNLSKEKATVDSSQILTKEKKVRFQSIKGGEWVFNIAAIDRAGNISETSHTSVQLKPLPPDLEDGPTVVRWEAGRFRLRSNVLLHVALYLLFGILFFVVFYITTRILRKYLAERRGITMKAEIFRKRKFGLRFKFSILIGVLVLLLTLGISGMLSIMTINHERRALAHQMIDKARLSLENMTNVAREGILDNDELLLLSLINKTMENKDIMYSIILDRNNRVIAHSDIEERGTVYTDDYTQMVSRSDTVMIQPEFSPDVLSAVYNLASPVTFAGQRIGSVRIGYSTDSIFRTIGEVRRASIINTIIITVVTIVIGVAGAVFMATVTIKPIKILATGANIIGGGNLQHKIQVKARDEIGLLADEFNRMTKRLLVYQREMEKKAKLDEQLDIARNIQQNMLPTTGIETDRLSIEGYYKAATGVGGDYYDFIEIGGGYYGLIMSDVAGKGVPASLMMIMIRTIFRSLIHSGVHDPSRVVTLMNATLSADISSDRFATLLFGVFNLKNLSFRYTNAGYGPIMLYRADKGNCIEIRPDNGSIPIGVMSDMAYGEEKPLKLGRGDALILFTDGISEARNRKKEEYGLKRLTAVVPASGSRGSITKSIIDDVLLFTGDTEQFDDMTLLVMKVKEK
jgi:sigma-B regulation protein RsbU (phosphoserine phosphatase)